MMRLFEARAAKFALKERRDEMKKLASLSRTPVRLQEWLVPGVVPRRASSMLIGKSGDGKDWVALHLAICVASGRPFGGRPVKQGRVLLVLLESPALNEQRIGPLATALGTSLTELEDQLERYPYPLLADDVSSMQMLAEWVYAREYALIVIDNLTEIRSSRSQSSENDSTAMGAALRPLAQLAQRGEINGKKITDNPPAILTLHHAGADGTARGSTAVPQHADYVIEIRRVSQKDPASLITISRGNGCRIASEELPIALRYRGIMPSPVVPEFVTHGEAPKVKTDPLRAKMLKLLKESPVTAGDLRTAMGANANKVLAVRKELEAEGLIESRDGLWRIVENSAA